VHTLARFAGDTFAIALPFASLQQAQAEAEVLRSGIFAAFTQAFTLDGHQANITAKAGIAIYPADGKDPGTLINHAEVALKNAKTTGEPYLFYAPQMNSARAAKLALERELQAALAQGQFVMHYQPRVDLHNGEITSAEALIRWQHPQRGLLGPAEFIAVAEETGLIVPLGAWVIDAVCAQQAAWLAAGTAIVPVAINLSAVQLKKGQLLQTVQEKLAAHRLEQQYIEFELTETVVMDNPERAAGQLHALKKLGMRLSLDDFGTGYSSLAYLKRFPFDFVKIDRAFVSDVTSNPGDAAIATAIVGMAHSLNLRVIAEGVETEGQLRFLRKLGCDEIQGYYFSRPVPAPDFEAMLKQGKCLEVLAEAEGSKGTLLIVDDEPSNLIALNVLFRHEGYRVLTASNGREGLDLLALNTVQVIISDQRMPGMSGAEFLDVVKDLYPDTIRIILSACTDLEEVTDSVNRGAVFKFLSKPWDSTQLRDNIRDAFRRYRPLQ
jgi:EAL domain-containing protein (putative c-di-GMP-specific phosphodiesterase class I)/CheY-like chemotaxis protein